MEEGVRVISVEKQTEKSQFQYLKVSIEQGLLVQRIFGEKFMSLAIYFKRKINQKFVLILGTNSGELGARKDQFRVRNPS